MKTQALAVVASILLGSSLAVAATHGGGSAGSGMGPQTMMQGGALGMAQMPMMRQMQEDARSDVETPRHGKP